MHDSVSQFVIKNAFQGFNTSVFTYGAKDTGKSWILFGDSRKHGLIHKVIESVYDKASAYDESTTFRTELRLVYRNFNVVPCVNLCFTIILNAQNFTVFH